MNTINSYSSCLTGYQYLKSFNILINCRKLSLVFLVLKSFIRLQASSPNHNVVTH
ncbi:unnamed protein product [Larinioides sclopetarius]|uniref:Uncharacterized protein n=1 Tax=Larinioides sclopetarius TaxID=280406 RepID=A0AAV1ZQK5_9ARAC